MGVMYSYQTFEGTIHTCFEERTKNVLRRARTYPVSRGSGIDIDVGMTHQQRHHLGVPVPRGYAQW